MRLALVWRHAGPNGAEDRSMRKWLALVGIAVWLMGTLTLVAASRHGVRQESIELKLADGTRVAGTLYYPKTSYDTVPAVVVAHGAALTRASCAPGMALPLARNGFLTLAVDALGHGQSEGTCSRAELARLLNRLDKLSQHPELEAAIDF